MRSALCLSLMLFTASTAWAQARRQLNDPPSNTAGAGTADDERARSIEAQLATDPVLRDDKIAIEVNGKRVRLSGRVDTADERTHAEEVVRQTDPTLTVENLLQATDEKQRPPAETTTTGDKMSESARRAGKTAKKTATEASEMITDGWITSQVKAQLMAADGVHASAINVDTNSHLVTLRGQVRSEAERRKAVKIARETRGVEQVLDQLTIALPPR